MKKKLKLNELKVKSFVTETDRSKIETIKGGFTVVIVTVTIIRNCSGNCGTAINVTCAANCDIRSIPFDECRGGGTGGADTIGAGNGSGGTGGGTGGNDTRNDI